MVRLENHLKFPHQTVKLRDTAKFSSFEVYEELGEFLVPPSKREKLYLQTTICEHFHLRKIRKDFVEEDYKLYAKSPLDKDISFLNIGFKR